VLAEVAELRGALMQVEQICLALLAIDQAGDEREIAGFHGRSAR